MRSIKHFPIYCDDFIDLFKQIMQKTSRIIIFHHFPEIAVTIATWENISTDSAKGICTHQSILPKKHM